MNEYTVYFEIFDKKLKSTVIAKSHDEAKIKVYEKIKVLHVKKITNQEEQIIKLKGWCKLLNELNNISKILEGK